MPGRFDPLLQQTTFKALAEVPSTESTPIHWFKSQRGNMPGRGGNGRASHAGQRNSFRTNPIASRLAPACRKARANSVVCGCPNLRCCRKNSRFSRSDSARAVTVSSSSVSSGPSRLGSKISTSSGAGHQREVLSQHSVLVTCVLARCFGLEHLTQLFL